MKQDRVFLLHILEAIDRVERYRPTQKTEFLANVLVQDAVLRNLEVIGEAARLISSDFKGKYPDIPWSKMSGMRNVLIHGYMTVDLDIVWDVTVNRLPSVKNQIAALLAQND